MPSDQRKKVRSAQEWSDWISLLEAQTQAGDITAQDALHAVNEIRQAVYSDIRSIRKRPLLVYASNFIGQPSAPVDIALDAVEGFIDLVESLKPEEKSADVILHSPGGSPDATERIVSVLRNRLDEVHFLVPHSAYSAATMLALSGNSITMHKNATLGPIDPQIDGVPAGAIKRGFENVEEKLKSEGPSALPAYIPLLEKYTLHLLERCNDFERLSKELVAQWLKNYMFAGQSKQKTIDKAVSFFADNETHITHSRPLTYEKVKGLGLKIEVANDNLGGLLWESYILINGFLSVTPFFKLYESDNGVSFGRQAQINVVTPPKSSAKDTSQAPSANPK